MKAPASWLLVATVVLPACWGGGGGRAVAGGGGGGTGDMQNLLPQPGPVNVSVTCSAPAAVVHAVVTPWRQRVDLGDTAVWTLAAATGARDLTVTARDTTWPFQNDSASGTPAHAAVSSPMKPNPVRNHAIPYTITVRCDSLTVVIDPELIIPTT